MKGGGEDSAVWQSGGETNAVGSSVEIGELIPAHSIGRRRSDGGASAVIEGDHHPLDAGLIDILLEVAIQVHPNEVTETCLVADEAKVHVDVVLTSGKCDGRGLPCRGVAITIGGFSAQLIRQAQKFAIRQSWRHSNCVCTWIQIPEAVETNGIRSGSAHRSSSVVVKCDDYVFDARLTQILDSIPVEIEPDKVAQRGFGAVVARVEVGVIVTSGQSHNRGAPCAGVGITILSFSANAWESQDEIRVD